MKKNVIIYFMLTLLFFIFSMFCSIVPSKAKYSPITIQKLAVSPRSSPIQKFILYRKVDVILITQHFPHCQERYIGQEYIIYNKYGTLTNPTSANPEEFFSSAIKPDDNNYPINEKILQLPLVNNSSNYTYQINNATKTYKKGFVMKTLYCKRIIPFTIFFGMINNNKILLQTNRLNYMTGIT